MLPRLKQGLDLLTSSAGDRTDRQRTLRGAIAWSYDLLDDGLKRLFARCAVFVNGARLEELEIVCGPATEIGRDVLDGVSELVDQSLMRQSDTEGESRIRMLVTIRDFALEKLDSRGEHDELRRRHCDAYLGFIERAAPQLQGKEQKRWLDLVELEHDNLRAALESALSDARTEESSRLLFALWRFWQSRGYLREGRVWADRVLALSGATLPQRMRSLEAAGGLAYWMADQDATRRIYGEMYERAKAHGSAAERANAAYNLSFTYFVSNAHNDAEAERLLNESIAAYREIGDHDGIARAAWALSTMLAQGRDHPPERLLRAQGLATEAYEHHRSAENRFNIGWDLFVLGLIALKMGDLREADARWREGLQIFVDAGDTSGLVIMLSNFGEIALAQGDLDRHATLVGAWTAIAQRTGVGLADLMRDNDGRALATDIRPEHRAALDRGRAMSDAEALAYARETEVAATA